MKLKTDNDPSIPQDGCRDIWAAVLSISIDDLQSRDPQIRRSAEAWFTSARRDIGSFLFVCSVLDLRVSLVQRVATAKIGGSADNPPSRKPALNESSREVFPLETPKSPMSAQNA